MTAYVKIYLTRGAQRDMTATGTTVWDETTEPVNTVTMYDETGETPAAYSVEFWKKIIIISQQRRLLNLVLV